MVYIKRIKTLNLPFNFHAMHQMTENIVLLDSGATENFVDKAVWRELHVGHFKLEKPLMVVNVDGTENRQGKIEHYCWLKVYF